MNRKAVALLFAGLVVTAWLIHDRRRQAAPLASPESSAPVSTRLVRKPRLPAPRMTVTAPPAEPSGSNYLIHDLVGLGIERQILERMDPAGLYDPAGHTVQDRLDELAQRREEIRELQGAVDPDGRWDSLTGVLQSLSEQDLISFFDRIKVSGELEALRWARSRLGGG